MKHVDAAVPAGEQPNADPSTSDAVRAQIDRIQSSADFDVPERARKFLRYIIDETLAGRADRIKAYSIALEVFGRDAGFDAQADPVVRIEAGRVRRALERYYLMAGCDDPMVVTIPKGGYVPLFVSRPAIAAEAPEVAAEALIPLPAALSPPRPWRWQLASAGLAAVALLAIGWTYVRARPPALPEPKSLASPDVPKLLIEPFADLTGSSESAVIVQGLTEEIIGQLAKFKELVIVESSAEAAAGTLIPTARARFELVGSVRIAGERLRLSARLRSSGDETILWAQNFDADLKVQELLSLQANLARQVTAALAQPYGVIFDADSALVTDTAPDDWEAYTCTLAYYTYRTDLRPEMRSSVQECLERTIREYPAYSGAWALLAITYIDDFRFRYQTDDVDATRLSDGLDAARRAISLDPGNVRGQQAYMMALHLGGESESALKVGEQALALNPNDSEFRAEYGLRLALSGQWKAGGELITEALSRSPGLQSYYEANLALAVFMQRDTENAAKLIRKADVRGNPLFHLIAASIYGRLDSDDEAAREREWLVANAAGILANIHEEVALRLVRPEDRDYFIEGLKLAGLPVPKA